MGTPVDEIANPFGDSAEMAESPEDTLNPSHRSSQDASGFLSSAEQSLPGSAGAKRREKKRVGFSGHADPNERSPRLNYLEADHTDRTLSPPRIGVTPPWGSPGASGATSPYHSRSGSGEPMLPPISPGDSNNSSRSHLPVLSPQQTQQIHAALNDSLPSLAVPRPRPAIRRTPPNQTPYNELAEVESDEPHDEARQLRRARAREAYERGKRLETDERARSEPNSRYTSPERNKRTRKPRLQTEDIQLQDLSGTYDGIDSDSDGGVDPKIARSRRLPTAEAHNLVRKHTVAHAAYNDVTPPRSGSRSGAVTPTEERDFFEDYRERPKEYRGGILGSLLKLYGQAGQSAGGGQKRFASGDYSSGTTPNHSPPESGTSTPRTWFKKQTGHGNHSTSSLARLIGSSTTLGSPVVSGLGEQVSQRLKEQQEEEKQRRHRHKRSQSSAMATAFNRLSRPKLEEEIRITVHIAETISRQRYLMKLCKALMLYGAPTHRLEEYMNMSARVLSIQAQFLYIPGSMIMSFDDSATHTTEVKLVRVTQGLDLGKLRDAHEVYKEVVHDRIGVEEATGRLDEINKKKAKHSRWFRIPIYGLAAVCVGPFAFGASLIDLPIAFVLGCILGVLQLVIAPRSDLYANVFEISATVITSFLARAFGSIPDGKGGRMFCFAALAQSSIALILPGYIVLCASLELQSRSIVAGSIRMVYAIIYSLFLGFGITIGSAIYGIMDGDAVSSTTCQHSMKAPYYFAFVPGFTMCLIIINQAKWKQAPVMLVIAFVGYLVNHYSSQRFSGNTQVSNALGALAIGVMANMYSRIGAKIENRMLDVWEDQLRHYWKYISVGGRRQRALEEGGVVGDAESTYERQKRRVGYGLAAAAMLPAIFVQVPSGIAVSGSLVSGIASADQITGNTTNGTTVVNSSTLNDVSGGLNDVAITVGYSVIQVAIGITVGLFLSAVVVYPLGKRRSGLFSF